MKIENKGMRKDELNSGKQRNMGSGRTNEADKIISVRGIK